MDHGWRLGPHWYVPVAQLPMPEEPSPAPGCSWAVVRRDGEGPRCLLQLWEPCPPVKVLDTLREEFLQRFSRAEAMDPGPCHLGFDEARLWFIQELGGIPLLRLWEQADLPGRGQLRAKLQEALAGSQVPRLLLPEVIGVDPGRMFAPRVLGAAPVAQEALLAMLDKGEPGPGTGERPWEAPPDLADGSRLPMRGRSRELTYLKSLMLGLSASIPMERVLIIQGEGGLGHDRLCDWAAAAAETEGIWVTNLEIYPGERAGGLLERVVQDLIGGMEADLYAAHPAVARALSRRMATFEFLRGGRRIDPEERKLEQEEIAAALEAMAFAQARHPRMVLIRSLERAAAEVPGVLKELVLASRLPWILSTRDPGRNTDLKFCLSQLKNSPESATVILDRLEDSHLGEILADILGAHDLPEAFLGEICSSSLGNPGLMQTILEMAQVQGAIRSTEGRWASAPDAAPVLEVRDDLVAGILLGRLQRLNAASLAAVRYLALVDEPLSLAILGRALGLDGDAVEEALHAAANAKLALVADVSARIAGPKVRELAIAHMPSREIQRCAQVLLKILGDKGGKPLLAVRLQSFALDRETALARVLQAIEQERTGPLEAERIVEETLKLAPDFLQEARLWEFLGDAWCCATQGDGLSMEGPNERAPHERALDALDKAIHTLGMGGAWSGWKEEERSARLHRKKALLEIRLRRLGPANQSLQTASALLADHPFHPEQPRIRLAAGRLHMGLGAMDKALATLEEGLDLLRQKPGMDDHRDHLALLRELGRAQGEEAHFQGALATLDALRRLAEHDGDRRMLALAMDTQGQVRLGMGQVESAAECMKEAMGLARSLDDLELLAECHLHLGIFWSCQQFLGSALSSLESAIRRFDLLGDPARSTQAQAWKARNLAALGDHGLSELILMRVASAGTDTLTPVERGERVFIDAEIAGFREAWGDARRHYTAAASRFEHAGLTWRARLARLRCIQAEAQEANHATGAKLKPAWIRLEQLKGPVEGTGSRWLELEWQRAHALLLSTAGHDGPILAQTLMAWGEVLAGARALKFPALVLEASTRSSELLLGLGEKLGARSRIQDALPSYQELWSLLPESFEKTFLGRKDIHGFQQAAEMAGMRIARPERVDPLADWNITKIDLPLEPSFRVSE